MNEESISRPDLRLLEVFQAVGRTKSFTKAGEDLGLTQSAVTRQIKQLEELLATDLLIRTTRSVNLTEAGIELLKTADHVLKDLDFRLVKFGERFLNKPPKVRLGLSHSIAHSHLPGLLTQFRRRHPGAQLAIDYDTANGVREKLQDNELDLAIFAEPIRPPKNLQQVHRFQDEFVIVTRRRGAGQRASAEQQEWLALDRSTTTGNLIADWMAQIDTNIVPTAEFSNFDAIINLVALGLGSSIVPRRAVRLYGERLPITEIEPSAPLQRVVGVYRNKSASSEEIVKTFVSSILFGWKADTEDQNQVQ